MNIKIHCEICGALLFDSGKFVLEPCVHYSPVPAPQPPKPGMFEKVWKSFRPCVAHHEEPDEDRPVFRAGYLAAVEQVREWSEAPDAPVGVIAIGDFLDQMASSSEVEK